MKSPENVTCHFGKHMVLVLYVPYPCIKIYYFT